MMMVLIGGVSPESGLCNLSISQASATSCGVAFWMQTGERQTAHLRLKYLQAVLKKDINFFDTEARDRNLIFHISSDAILVQDAIGDKIGHCLRYLSQFLIGFAIGFASVWKLSLLTLAIVPLMAIAGGAYTIIMSTLSEKSEAAYAESGKVAEEVISQVRTVYSFVGENKAVEAYSNSLKNALKMGKKSGFAKGLGVGFSYGLLFCAWALLLWYASLLVKHRETNGGKAFTTIINVVFSGFALGQAAPNLAATAKGKILLDGHDVKNLQFKLLREQMGLVCQEPALFATTIARNILYGKEDADMNQIIEAA